MKAAFHKKEIIFKFDAGTSRGVLKTKWAWFIFLSENGKTGIGECNILPKLSPDEGPDFEKHLNTFLQNIRSVQDIEILLYSDALRNFPSIRFGLETAYLDLKNGGIKKIFDTAFYSEQKTIPINGLIWMGSKEYMLEQVEQKLKEGFTCLKMKIGAIQIQDELDILKFIRQRYSPEQLILRVDANGAFTKESAKPVLEDLHKLSIHSIEQPITAGQTEAMAELCKNTPTPIALDEELIGIFDYNEKVNLLKAIKPQYIILKPGLIGGFKASDDWILAAQNANIPYWITSALETNIGLNAICQYTDYVSAAGHQGLGTGSLFTNNISSPLVVDQGHIKYSSTKSWDSEYFS